ncbi:unnamed protein product [Acanthoscelides obtectus]|uniref:RING-type domain-containing protein n=1 Tax=Acanthoscelides obtectus TaxID=200917 RepID=A0A9P0QGQ4_ACAOB|nr:unnamed protein product [Acanthoscelides obtectus]CAK1682409.1 Probable E3 ubiquitin-protein ligase RNF144A [Acanthoscelides obtectus]
MCSKIYISKHAELCHVPKCPVGAAAAAPPPESTDSETVEIPSNLPIPESVSVACPECGERYSGRSALGVIEKRPSCTTASWRPSLRNSTIYAKLSVIAASPSEGKPEDVGIPFDSDLIKCCPMCNVPIEKDEGCAQMMCKRCKHVFCWYCLASLDVEYICCSLVDTSYIRICWEDILINFFFLNNLIQKGPTPSRP